MLYSVLLARLNRPPLDPRSKITSRDTAADDWTARPGRHVTADQ